MLVAGSVTAWKQEQWEEEQDKKEEEREEEEEPEEEEDEEEPEELEELEQLHRGMPLNQHLSPAPAQQQPAQKLKW